MTRALVGIAALSALCAPTGAHAATKPKASATISACSGDRLTIAATVDSAGVRKLRGTTIQVRFHALPLFGLPRATGWLGAGKAKKVNRSQAFAELPADAWVGAVRWRFRKGRKTVASGLTRTRSGRAGGRRGRGTCVLPVGLRPKDLVPPRASISPTDSTAWHRAPLALRINAEDDFSGVADVYSRIDGGPVVSGRTPSITGEGEHLVEYGARDVAGNRSPGASVRLRVDGGPPTAPVIDFPPATTGDTTPEVRWSAAADTGSGVRRYFVTVNAADGRLVAARDVAATGASSQSVTISEGLAAGTYSAQVFAFDGAVPEPFSSASAKRSFTINDQPPSVSSTSPADGAVVPASQRGQDIVLSFDRAMDAATVTDANITLTRTGGQDPTFSVTCGSPCVSATIDPQGDLDGEYTVAWTSDVQSAEGDALTAGSITFSVNAFETRFDGGCGGWSTSGDYTWTCPGNNSRAVINPVRDSLLAGPRTAETVGPAVSYVPDGNPMHLTFDASFTQLDSDSYRAGLSFDGGACTYGSALTSGGTKTVQINAPSNRSTVAVCFELTIQGEGSGGATGSSLTVDNIVLDRTP